MYSAHALHEKRGIPVRHVNTNVTTFTYFGQNWSIGCLLALYGSTKHPAQLCGGFGQFFFCFVFWSPWNIKIHGGFRSTWGDNFYMGTQNESKLEIWPDRILIHAFESKLRPFEVFPYVFIGKPCVCNVFRSCAMWKTGNTRAHKRDDLYLLWSKLEYRVPACIVWLY